MRRLATTGLAAGLLLALVPLTTQISYAASAAPAAVAPAIDASTPDGTYTAVTPARLYDSRTNLKRALKPGEAATIPVLGRAGVPATGVSAVVVNVTVNAPQRSGYLAAYPSTSSGTGISTVTFAAGDTRASLATVPVGSGGSIKVRNAAGTNAGTANAIVDIQGYYSTAAATATTKQAGYFASSGQRLLDTRDPDIGALRPFDIIDVDLKFYDSDTDEDRVQALAVNLTAVHPTAAGYLVAYDGSGDEPPATSNVNFVRGATTPNNAVVPVRHLTDDDGTRFSSFSIGNGSYTGNVDVVADFVGVYARDDQGELRFKPLSSPVRILNTSVGRGFGTLGANKTGTATAPSSVAVPGTTSALVGTLTGVRATAPTYLTAWPAGESRPESSNLNPAKGQTVSNHAVVALSQSAGYSVYNLAGTTNVSYDVSGRFDIPAASTSTAQRQRTAAAQDRLSHVDVTGTGRRDWTP